MLFCTNELEESFSVSTASELRQAFDLYLEALQKHYSQVGSKLGLSEQECLIHAPNLPSFSQLSSQEIVISLHGFMGSPWEMDGSTQVLHSQGLSSLNLLIPGFGANPKLANHFSAKDWESYLDPLLDIAVRCFSRVHFIGFSTGALLIHSYLRRRFNGQAKKVEVSRSTWDFRSIKSICLISPYYFPYNPWSAILLRGLQKMRELVAVDTLFRISRNPDLQIMMLRKQEYMQAVPLLSARRVGELGIRVGKADPVSIPLPVLVFLSGGDRVLNLKGSEKSLRRDFRSVRIESFSDPRVPHHLMVQAVYSGASRVWMKIRDFIQSRA